MSARLYLLVLQLDAHHSEGVVGSVVVDVDAAESLLSGLDGHPLLAGVIVDHDRGPGLADALLAGERERKGVSDRDVKRRLIQGQPILFIIMYLTKALFCDVNLRSLFPQAETIDTLQRTRPHSNH